VTVKNLAASVQARLQNHARATKDVDVLGQPRGAREEMGHAALWRRWWAW
jgi:hypothetical protein